MMQLLLLLLQLFNASFIWSVRLQILAFAINKTLAVKTTSHKALISMT